MEARVVVISHEAVFVPSEAHQSIKRVQTHPGVDKYSAAAVIEVAMLLKELEALLWVSANPSEYMQGIFEGFIEN